MASEEERVYVRVRRDVLSRYRREAAATAMDLEGYLGKLLECDYLENELLALRIPREPYQAIPPPKSGTVENLSPALFVEVLYLLRELAPNRKLWSAQQGVVRRGMELFK